MTFLKQLGVGVLRSEMPEGFVSIDSMSKIPYFENCPLYLN